VKLLIDLALADGQTIIAADTDFGAHQNSTGAIAPSVVLVREVIGRQPPEPADLLTSCLEQRKTQLTAGAMIALTTTGARVRRPPLL
jgi:hypothetical protein